MHSRWEQRSRSLASWLQILSVAVLCSCLLPAFAALPAGARAPVSVVSVCSDRSRLIALDLDVDGRLLTLKATCIVNGPSAPLQEAHTRQLSFSADPGLLRSVYAPEAQERFETLVTIDGAVTQSAEIRRLDGQACATVSAKVVRKFAVPRRFIAGNGQWGQSVGYMLDDQCQVVAVSLGNRVAVFRTRLPVTFEIYGISFTTK